MLLKPSQEIYDELHRLVQSGQSFDGDYSKEILHVMWQLLIIYYVGADQGLLNTHFEGKWHRLPFTYNCTPSASYQ